MKVIDLLNKIASGEEVPKKIQVYSDIFVFDNSNAIYEHEETRTNLLSIYNGNILNYEVVIIEDKKIEKMSDYMKINSEHLYEYINDLATDEKVKFKVYYDDSYVTEIYWNGESFEWDTGTFTSEAFFNPLYDFEVIEEDKKIRKVTLLGEEIKFGSLSNWLKDSTNNEEKIVSCIECNAMKINEIIDKINNMEVK